MDRLISFILQQGARGWQALWRMPPAIMAFWFAGQILLGGILLSLPFCHADSRVSFMDALFTAVSATCVTGLTVVNTSSAYNTAGQIIILALIQCGGLGIMTFAAIVFQILGWRMNIQSQAALEDSIYQRTAARELRRVFRRIIWLAVSVEMIGALLLCAILAPREGLGRAAYSGFFHSISAFCNAGFSLYADGLMAIRQEHAALALLMILIVLGGLGHTVLYEIWEALARWRRGQPANKPHVFTYHTRLVMMISALLILLGAAGLLFFGLTPYERTWGERLWAAVFHSIAARTAGYNTIEVGRLPTASLLWLALLMFIGGSPGSCAGGIKTTSAMVCVSALWARVRHLPQTIVLGMHVSEHLIARAVCLLGLACLWNIVGVFILLTAEAANPAATLAALLFEQISAFGTVGLSTGYTPALTAVGKLWIMATMFVGRLGPLALALVLVSREIVGVRYPEGRVMIG